MIKTIIWKNNTVVLIDQRALPLVERYVACKSYKEVISAIKDLTVRGAPAIGVAAAMGAHGDQRRHRRRRSRVPDVGVLGMDRILALGPVAGCADSGRGAA